MGAVLVDDGEYAGWYKWTDDYYECETVGPFYFRKDEQGHVTSFRAEQRHLNGHGNMHGGCIMSLADSALFTIATDALGEDSGVTVSFASEFISGVKEGERVEARGDVMRSGGSLIFVRGVMTVEDRIVLNFSGTIKRLRQRPAPIR